MNSVPPFGISGSARCAMRMKVQHDTSMVVRKPVPRHVDDAPLQRLLGREGDGMDDEIELAPLLGDALEHRLHLAGRVHVERHEDRRFQLLRQRLDIFLCLLVEIGDGELGAERAEGLGAAPGDRVLVGDADDEAPLAFEELGFDDGDHGGCPLFPDAIPVPAQQRPAALAPPLLQSAISGTFFAITSSASVAAITWATEIPGPVSSKVARPSWNAITASSVTTRSTGRSRRDRQRAFLHDLRLALGGVLHRHDDPLGAGHQVHGAAHARHHLAGDHPVGEMPRLIDLQAAEHREVEMAAADQAERHGAVERAGAGQRGDRPAARVGQRRMRHAFLGRRAGADQPVLGLEEHLHACGHDSSRPASECRCRD